jgi:hypothetical protein
MEAAFNRSFEDGFQAILLTSGRGQGFPTANESALKTKTSAARLATRGLNKRP